MIYWSDPHLFHAKTLEEGHCNRPFSSVEEMNGVLINNFNEVSTPNDDVFCLGDFVFGENKYEKAKAIIPLLNHKTFTWIPGNHDNRKAMRQLVEDKLIEPFDSIVLKYFRGQGIVMSHYAMKTWEGQGKSNWMLFGHSHSTLPDDLNVLSLDVGVDTCLYDHRKFYPYTFDEIKRIMGMKTPLKVDHH